MLMISFFLFFFKQKTAYEMRISDWSSDVCSSDLKLHGYRYDQRPGDEKGKPRTGGRSRSHRPRRRQGGGPCRRVHQEAKGEPVEEAAALSGSAGDLVGRMGKVAVDAPRVSPTHAHSSDNRPHVPRSALKTEQKNNR